VLKLRNLCELSIAKHDDDYSGSLYGGGEQLQSRHQKSAVARERYNRRSSVELSFAP
jgi:hypothetical protein